MPVDTKSAKRFTESIIGTIKVKSEKAVTIACVIGRGHATNLTPVDLSTLINSQYMRIEKTEAGWRGTVGYTARYAKWVHNAPGTLMGQPRAHFGVTSNRSRVGPQKPKEFGGGSQTGKYWDPNAKPKFLKLGFEENLDAIRRAVKGAMKL